MSMLQQYGASQPLVSVITATYNAAATVDACLKSVAIQDYPNLEHLVIDGASTDATMQIVKQHNGVRWVSEPDSGIYSAWNKGLEMARGSWIAFLGADDCYLPGAVTAYMRLAGEHPEAEYLSGLVQWIGPAGRSRTIGGPWSWRQFQRYMCTAHVGSMHARELFERYGRYDTTLKIVADYELLLRAGAGLRTAFLPEATVIMQGGGTSDSLAALEETAQVKVATGKRSSTRTEFERVVAKQKFHARRMLSRWL